MPFRSVVVIALSILALSISTGCSTSGSSGGGWIVVGDPGPSEPPPRHKAPPPNSQGMETAARNHIRSAYRFLEKGKPDHAIRELEKARDKMGNNYWFHYYMGGAYFLKGLYQQAHDSWNISFRYTSDGRLGSRVRTCQSFAAPYLRGEDQSVGFLKAALDLDRENHQARELLDDLSYARDEDNKGRGKKDREKGSSGKKNPRKIKDKNRFSAYFLIEMP